MGVDFSAFHKMEEISRDLIFKVTEVTDLASDKQHKHTLPS
jgi:hypothetical protein